MKATIISADEAQNITAASDPRIADPEINILINKINEAIISAATLGYSAAHVKFFPPIEYSYQAKYLKQLLICNGYSAFFEGQYDLFIDW